MLYHFVFWLIRQTGLCVTALPAFPNGHPACAGLKGLHGGVGRIKKSIRGFFDGCRIAMQFCMLLSRPPWLDIGWQHETSNKTLKMSQRVPVTEKIKESSLKGPSLLFSYVPLPHFECFICTRDAATQNLDIEIDHLYGIYL